MGRDKRIKRAEELRKDAEWIVRAHPNSDDESIFNEAINKKILHELQVHQVELEMQSEELKRVSAEKELLALQQQLQQSRRLESLGVLAGGIAHDFNNILAVIIGNCGMIKIRPDFTDKYIQQIEIAAENAAGLCRQMLAYAGKSEPAFALTEITPLVTETINLLQATIAQNASITLETCNTLPQISGDASQIRQILMNLVINAAEAIGEKQGEIRVLLEETDIKADQSVKDHLGEAIEPGAYICLEVTDTGCGMDKETCRRLFEPFYSTKFTGRGLGLSAVLGIIKSHGGALQLFSRPGQGTTFKIYLPVHDNRTSGEGPAVKPRPSGPWRGSGTVLLAEDEEQVRNIARLMLEELGFTVIQAANGKEALELYEKNAAEITLAMFDIGMPLMNGYELFSKIRKLNPDLPVIISSGFGDADIISHIARKNLAGIASKPYRFDQLMEVVKGAVKGAFNC